MTDEVRVHRWDGDPSRLPLLALHGFTGRGSDFEGLARSVDRMVVAPDLPGHGPGAETEAWSMDRAMAWLDALVEEEGWERFLAIGYSMGGRIALSWAVQHPQGLQGLVCVGATAGIEEGAPRADRQHSDNVLADRIESIGVDAFLDEWSRHPLIQTQSRIPEPLASTMKAARREHLSGGLAASLRGLGAGTMPPVWSQLPRIGVPVLLVHGQEDQKFADLADSMARRLPAGRCAAIPGAGHCAHLEAPAFFLELMKSFAELVDPESEPYTGRA